MLGCLHGWEPEPAANRHLEMRIRHGFDVFVWLKESPCPWSSRQVHFVALCREEIPHNTVRELFQCCPRVDLLLYCLRLFVAFLPARFCQMFSREGFVLAFHCPCRALPGWPVCLP